MFVARPAASVELKARPRSLPPTRRNDSKFFDSIGIVTIVSLSGDFTKGRIDLVVSLRCGLASTVFRRGLNATVSGCEA